MKADALLEAGGLVAPIAAIRLRKALEGMEEGEVLDVRSISPGDMDFFISISSRLGHEVLDPRTEEGGANFYVRKGRRASGQ